MSSSNITNRCAKACRDIFATLKTCFSINLLHNLSSTILNFYMFIAFISFPTYVHKQTYSIVFVLQINIYILC